MRFFWLFTVAMACLAALSSASPAPRPDNPFEEFERAIRRVQQALANAAPAIDVVMKGRALIRNDSIDEDD